MNNDTQIREENIWDAAKTNDTDLLLQLLSSSGVDVNERNSIGETALHIACSMGNCEAALALLSCGADSGISDWESCWTPLHRSVYHCHLRVTLLLLKHGAYLGDEESYNYTSNQKSRTKPSTSSFSEGSTPLYCPKGAGGRWGDTPDPKRFDRDGQSPLDLLSLHLRSHLSTAKSQANGGDVWAFGKADFQLGFSVAHGTLTVERPRRIGALGLQAVTSITAARHHTVAITREGRVYTWGHGRGGRLGHGDENPRLTPTLVATLAHKQIVCVAAAENHTVCASADGNVYSWGSDRFGQLGLSSNLPGGCRLAPNKVETLRRVQVVGVAAGASHTVALTSDGEVFTWGSDKAGQLGLTRHKRGSGNKDTSLSGISVGLPRRVDALLSVGRSARPRKVIQVSAAINSTVAILSPAPESHIQVNEVYEWGHGNPTPVKVHFKPREKSSEKFFFKPSWFNINIIQVSAARFHTVALSSNGTVYTWGIGAESLGLDSDKHASTHSTPVPCLVEAMLPSAGGGVVVAVSACDNRTCAVTDTGDLFSWGASHDQGVLGHGRGRWQPVPKRVAGLKRVVHVSAGPEHTVVLLAASIPPLCHTPSSVLPEQKNIPLEDDEDATLEEELHQCSEPILYEARFPEEGSASVLSLKQMCEKVLSSMVDLKNAVMMLAHAEANDAPALTTFCSSFIRQNLDGILVLGRPAGMEFLLEESGSILKDLVDSRTPSHSRVTSKTTEYFQEGTSGPELGDSILKKANERKLSWGCALRKDPSSWDVGKAIRSCKKKLAQIAELEKIHKDGQPLSPDQLLKIGRKDFLECDLRRLEPLLGKLEQFERASLIRRNSSDDCSNSPDVEPHPRLNFSESIENCSVEIAIPPLLEATSAKDHQGDAEKEPESLCKPRTRSHVITTDSTESPLQSVTAFAPSSQQVLHRCEMCDLDCPDRVALQQHLRGKKHAAHSRSVQEKLKSQAPGVTASTRETSGGTPGLKGTLVDLATPTANDNQSVCRLSASLCSSPWKTPNLHFPTELSCHTKKLEQGLETSEKPSFKSILEEQHLAACQSPQQTRTSSASDLEMKNALSTGKSPRKLSLGVSRGPPDASLREFSPNHNVPLSTYVQQLTPSSPPIKKKTESPAPWNDTSKCAIPEYSPVTKKTFLQIQLEEEEQQKNSVQGCKENAWYIRENVRRSDSIEKIQQQQQHETELQEALKAIEAMERLEADRLAEEKRAKRRSQRKDRARLRGEKSKSDGNDIKTPQDKWAKKRNGNHVKGNTENRLSSTEKICHVDNQASLELETSLML